MSICDFCGTACSADLPVLATSTLVEYVRSLNALRGLSVLASESRRVCRACRTEAARSKRPMASARELASLPPSETMLVDKSNEERDRLLAEALQRSLARRRRHRDATYRKRAHLLMQTLQGDAHVLGGAVSINDLAARLDAATESDAEEAREDESAELDYEHFADVLLSFGVSVGADDIGAIIEGADTAAASSAAAPPPPLSPPLSSLPTTALHLSSLPLVLPPLSPSLSAPAYSLPPAPFFPLWPVPAPCFFPLSPPLPSPSASPPWTLLPQFAPPSHALLYSASAPTDAPSPLQPPLRSPSPALERRAERDRTPPPPPARAASPPRVDSRGRRLQPRGDRYITRRYVVDNQSEAVSILLAGIQRLEAPLRKLRTAVPWHDVPAFERLCDDAVPGFFAQWVRLLTPARPVARSVLRARCLAPLMLLDVLSKRSNRQSALPLMRSRVLTHAGTSRTGLQALHAMRETPARSTIHADSVARAALAPAVINSHVARHSTAALTIIIDDFHYFCTSRAPGVSAASTPAHLVSAWQYALSAGTRDAAAIAADAELALFPTPVVQSGIVVPLILQRLRRAGAFKRGAGLSLLAHRNLLVDTQAQSLLTTGTWSTDAARLASGAAAQVDGAAVYSADDRAVELADGLCASFVRADLHSATDGWRFLCNVFDPAQREPLVRYAMSHGVFVPGDNPAVLLATAAALHARMQRAAHPAPAGRADQCLAIGNLIPKMGELHAQLGEAKAVLKLYRPIINVLWCGVFGARPLPKTPRPERLLRVLTVGLAGWFLVREQLLSLLATSLDVQDRYVLQFFEVHAPLAVLFFSLESRGHGDSESYFLALSVFQLSCWQLGRIHYSKSPLQFVSTLEWLRQHHPSLYTLWTQQRHLLDERRVEAWHSVLRRHLPSLHLNADLDRVVTIAMSLVVELNDSNSLLTLLSHTNNGSNQRFVALLPRAVRCLRELVSAVVQQRGQTTPEHDIDAAAAVAAAAAAPARAALAPLTAASFQPPLLDARTPDAWRASINDHELMPFIECVALAQRVAVVASQPDAALRAALRSDVVRERYLDGDVIAEPAVAWPLQHGSLMSRGKQQLMVLCRRVGVEQNGNKEELVERLLMRDTPAVPASLMPVDYADAQRVRNERAYLTPQFGAVSNRALPLSYQLSDRVIEGDVVCCAANCPDRTEFLHVSVHRFGCGCAYHDRPECKPAGDECASCVERYERVLQRECASRNATIDALVAELSGGPAAPAVNDDDDDSDDATADDDSADAALRENAAAPSLESMLADLGDERRNTAEWVRNIFR